MQSHEENWGVAGNVTQHLACVPLPTYQFYGWSELEKQKDDSREGKYDGVGYLLGK